jgi:hypothetical protein
VNLDERRERFARLPRRTRQLVEVLVRRPELSIVDAAAVVGISEHNARKRLRCDVYAATGLDVEGRTHLVAEYRDVIGPQPTSAEDACTSE